MILTQKYNVKRRYAFPLMMVGALMTAAVLAGKADTPTQKFEYLNDLVPNNPGVFSSAWVDSEIQNIEKLSQADKEKFMDLIESADFNASLKKTRTVYAGQAKRVVNDTVCSDEDTSCEMSVYLNREITPTFVHGDLRLVSLEETAIRRDLEIDKLGDNVEQLGSFEQTRQMRFMLTQRGWVQTTSEVLSEVSLQEAFPSTFGQTEQKYSGINYYPRTASWDEFWSEFPEDEIQTDLDFVTEVGANALRIFVNHAYFTDSETKQDALIKLRSFLDWCEPLNLNVIVTLFDLRADYRLTNWAMDSAHVRDVLGVIGDHKAVLAIDLKNQPDLDFERSGEQQVEAWLAAMMDSARYQNPNTPITIGWSDFQQTNILSKRVDFVSYHDYRSVAGTEERLALVKTSVGTKPVFVTEIGNSRWSLTGENSKKQHQRLEARLSQLGNADGVFVWTLHDFEHVGTNIVGHRPWRRAQQKVFGIAKADYSLQPAGQAFKSFNSNYLNQNLETE